MSRGNLIVGPAAVVAFVCFFLPWITSSCQGQEVATLSGRELAAGTTIQVRPIPGAPLSRPQEIKPQRRLFAIPVAAIACFVLVALAVLRVIKPQLAGLVAAILAIVCLLVLLDRTLATRKQADQNGFDVSLRYGAIGTTLAYVAVLIGGLISMFTGWTPGSNSTGAGPPER